MIVPEVLPPEPVELATEAEVHALWHAGVLDWKLWDQQVEIYDAVQAIPLYYAAYIIFLCARQFGKSFLGLLLAVQACLRFRNKCFLYMGPTAKQAMEIARPKMKEICRDAPRGLIRFVSSLDKWEIGTCELVVSGFNTNSTAQRGKTLQDVYVEEVRDADPDDYIRSLKEDIGPALTHSDGGRTWFFTTPPDLPDHPFITDTMVAAELTGTVFRRTIYDNKMLTPQQFQAFVDRCGGIDTDAFKREGLCIVIRDRQKVVIPHYDQNVHVREFEPPVMAFWQATGDWGGVRDKTVFLLHTYDFLQDLELIWDELVFPANTPTTEIVVEVRKAWGDEVGKAPGTPDVIEVVADVPGQTLVDLTDLKFCVRMPPKTDWLAGVNSMSVVFAQRAGTGRPKILIHPRCKFLQLSCRSGTFNRQKTDFARTEALGHCDALATLMYAHRTVRRDNPWPNDQVPQEQIFRKAPPPSEKDSIAHAIQPKTFGAGPGQKHFSPRKFGKFRG